MSVRPIEVQGAIPFSQKTGKIQEQLQQRGQVGQEILGQAEKEVAERKRVQVGESNESEKSRFHKDSQSGQQQEEKQQKKNKKEQTQATVSHPYKGKFVDFSG